VPVNPNHGPQATASGRLIICGNISFPYTDDPAWLLERCAASGTVFCSRLPEQERKDPLAYVERLGALVRKTRSCDGRCAN
jgi:hypothetical protein